MGILANLKEIILNEKDPENKYVETYTHKVGCRHMADVFSKIVFPRMVSKMNEGTHLRQEPGKPFHIVGFTDKNFAAACEILMMINIIRQQFVLPAEYELSLLKFRDSIYGLLHDNWPLERTQRYFDDVFNYRV